MSKDISYYLGSRPEMVRFVPVCSQRILEIGCGGGEFAKSILTKEREIWGVEINREAAKKAECFLHRVFNSPIENILDALPNNYFDLIVFNDVLEHLVDPFSIIHVIHFKLQKDGEILASIPNLRFGKILFKLIYYKDFTYTESGILDNTHLRFFTEKTIRKLFEENGYQINLMVGITRSKSILAFVFAAILSILTFSNNMDCLYPQFVIRANYSPNK